MSPFDTIWPADSAEFCPHPSAQSIFVCGTYKLEQSQDPPTNGQKDAEDTFEETSASASEPQARKGKCLLFRVHDDDQLCHGGSSISPLLAIADSEGHVTLHQLNNEESRLSQVQSISCVSSDRLCLSLDWSNRRNPTSGLGDMIVSLSDGSLALLRPGDDGLIQADSWHAHDYEPWIAAWDYCDNNIVYSGGDDLKMKGWDVRQGGTQPIFTNKRFDAGVTTIQSHPHIDHILAVGSYDSTVRIFDTRKPSTSLTQVDVGGGAWRVKWHPSETRKADLLVACMHDGFKVVQFDLSGNAPEGVSCSGEVLKRFDKHASLAYGVDWSFAGETRGDATLVASCSFYDHTLHLWRA